MTPDQPLKQLRALEEQCPEMKLNRLQGELDDLSGQLRPALYKQIRGLSLADATHSIAGEFSELPTTSSEPVRKMSFEENVEPLSNYLTTFFRLVSGSFSPEAVYLEMNAFTINTGGWMVDAFAYRRRRSLRKLDWLSNWDSPSIAPFELVGVDHIRSLFVRPSRRDARPIQERLAQTVSEFLIALRFSEAVAKAHRLAARQEPMLRNVSVLSDAHDYDLLYESRVAQPAKSPSS